MLQPPTCLVLNLNNDNDGVHNGRREGESHILPHADAQFQYPLTQKKSKTPGCEWT